MLLVTQGLNLMHKQLLCQLPGLRDLAHEKSALHSRYLGNVSSARRWILEQAEVGC